MVFEDFRKSVLNDIQSDLFFGQFDNAEAAVRDMYKDRNDVPVVSLARVFDIGGITGGNCWGDEADIFRYGYDDASKFEELDDLLVIYAPDINITQRNRIEEMVQTEGYIEYEYYGNSSHKMLKLIPLSEIHDFLMAEHLLAKPDNKEISIMS